MDHNPVGWFEIPVRNMKRAREFYERLLGVSIDVHSIGDAVMGWFPMVPGSSGAAGSLVEARGHEPSSDGVLVYFTAPDLEDMLERAAEAGGEVITGLTDIGDYGFIGIIRDTEGNRIGLHRRN